MRKEGTEGRLIPSFGNAATPWPKESGERAAVLMSGGVDSASVALLLKNRGFAVTGLTMDISGKKQSARAAEVCRTLSIPHFYIDLSDVFRENVLEPFIKLYGEGVTPNPCCLCNETVKLGALVDIATEAWGRNFVFATGHYAKIERNGRGVFLAMADDIKKDQSYFLAGVRKDTIERLILPLGTFKSKELTRALAAAGGLSVSHEQESMDICFAERGDYRGMPGGNFKPGPIVDADGKVLGEHAGISAYTVGQRKGLGVQSGEPLYVAEIRAGSNTIVAAPRGALMKYDVSACNLNVLIEGALRRGAELQGKIRSQNQASPCIVTELSDRTAKVRFEKAQFAPTRGQRLVLYTKEGYVAAGGIITV